MKGITSFLVTFGLLITLSAAKSSTVEKTKPVNRLQFESPLINTSSNSVRCGEALNASTGGISYKAFEPLEPNERCVWVIRGGGNTAGFNVNVLYLGFNSDPSPNGTQLIASCLRHYFKAFYEVFNQTGLSQYLSYCDVLLLTLATGPDVQNSTGFVLQYETVAVGNRISHKSTDNLIATGEPGLIRYPEGGVEYDNEEFTTLVFEPSNNIYVPGKRINLVYIRGRMESIFDFLRVYVFNASSTSEEKWEYKGEINDDKHETELIFNQDLILIEFHSDRNNPGTGFQILHTTSGIEGCN